MWPILLLTSACWSPKDTGPQSMIGVVSDAAGAPIPGLSMDTIEAHAVTDAEGRFGVNYKEPSQWVGFEHQALAYRRTWRPEDNGTVVQIQVPPTQPATLRCELVEPCDAVMTWELPEGLTISSRLRCDRTAPLQHPGLPAGPPTHASCRATTTAPEQPLFVQPSADGYVISPPPVPLRIQLISEELPLPERCEVEVDGRGVTPQGDGAYVAKVFGTVTIVGRCDRIPATPRRAYVRDPAELEIVWSRTTPTLDLSTAAPWVDRLTVLAIEGTETGWTIELPRSPSGVFVLPPLPKGAYVFGAGLPKARLSGAHPDPAAPRAVLAMAELPTSLHEGGAPRQAVGVVVLDAPLTSGPLPVSWRVWE